MRASFLPYLTAAAYAQQCSIKNYQEFVFFDNDTCPIRNDKFKGPIIYNNETIQCFGYSGTCKQGEKGPKNDHGMRSETPSDTPSKAPTMRPTMLPTSQPITDQPTKYPTTTPTSKPSNEPSTLPSTIPSNMPSSIPTYLEYIVVPCNKTV